MTFHVGSQCCNIDNWVSGIRAAKRVFAQLTSHGFMPELLNLGGGYPLQFNGDEPSIEQIGEAINRELETISDDIQVMAEPGRFLAGSAGCLVSQIVGIATANDARWITGYGCLWWVDGIKPRISSVWLVSAPVIWACGHWLDRP